MNHAGINLTGYHLPGPRHSWTFAPKCGNVCPAPWLFHNRKCAEDGPINDDVPGAVHLHQLVLEQQNYQHSHQSAVEGLAKSKRLRTLYQTAYLLSANKLTL